VGNRRLAGGIGQVGVKPARFLTADWDSGFEFMRFDYAAPGEARSLVALRDSYGLFIGGSFTGGASVFKTISPATEEVLAEVTHGSTDDVDRAVLAARQAYERIWSAMPGRARSRYLFAIARLIQERAGELAILDTLDGGRPIRQTSGVDVQLAAAHFFYHAGWADKLGYAGFGPSPRPLGVVGQITSWSSPLLMLAWQLAPALACGNTVILKPSEATPLTALAFAEICRQADLPPGVVNVVTGDGSTGQLVASHPGLDKVSFTGSAEVGKEIARACALSGKPLTLKLGGTAVNIVCADADIEAAAGAIVAGVFVDQGHVGSAGSRVLVEAPARDALVTAIRRRMGALTLGDPLDVNTDVGAVVSRAQLDKITDLAASGEAEGARRWSSPVMLPDHGFWFPPAMFTHTSDAHGIGSAELAGPMITVSAFGAPAEAVERAGGSRYGLAAGVWTERGSVAGWLASRLRAGVIWVNAFNRFDPTAPFGGYREAGLGREGGRHGLEAYLYGPADDPAGGLDV
jgi:aldehyde dehydrogenase (NAD+)